MFYYKPHLISPVEKLKVYNYPLVKRLVYGGAIWRKELDARILKRAVLGGRSNSCFVSAEAVN